MKRIEETGCQVYLVNTGWTGGTFGEGKRFDIPTTRSIISAILSGDVKEAKTDVLMGFNFRIPISIPNVEARLLNPIDTWKDPKAI